MGLKRYRFKGEVVYSKNKKTLLRRKGLMVNSKNLLSIKKMPWKMEEA